MKKRIFVFALVLLVAGRLRAGGSVDFADVRQILHQKPAIESLLLEDLIVDPAYSRSPVLATRVESRIRWEALRQPSGTPTRVRCLILSMSETPA